MSYSYPTANWTERKAIITAHEQYTRGLLYFLANDDRIPQSLRSEMQSWGWCGDEFNDTNHFPFQLYVREARRMVSEAVFTMHDRISSRFKRDAIGLGTYNMDAHHAQRIAQKNSKGELVALNEGCISGFRDASFAHPFQISYSILTPPRSATTASNLLVPVCVSASHVGYGCLRLEPQYMIMGQAAGTAAHLALVEGVAVQDVDMGKLQALLLAQGARLAA
jgi:hypothetical protein